MQDEIKTTLIEAYTEYLDALDTITPKENYLPFNWYQVNESYSLEWYPYIQMLNDFASEISNEINQFIQINFRKMFGLTQSFVLLLSGFRIKDSGLRIQDLGFMIKDSGFEI